MDPRKRTFSTNPYDQDYGPWVMYTWVMFLYECMILAGQCLLTYI